MYCDFVKKPMLAVLLGLASVGDVVAKDVVWYDGNQPVCYSIQKNVDPVVKVAAQMFADDMKAVTGKEAVAADKEKTAVIKVVELDKLSSSAKKQLARQGVPIVELLKKIDGFHILL